MSDVLTVLAAALRADGGLLAAATVDPAADADRRRGEAVAALPRAATVGPALALAIEATREAELLHHAPAAARVVRTDDRDLALLAGDRLYALGLARLATGGWTDEVAVLADVVVLVARLHAEATWGPDGGGADPVTAGDVAATTRTDALWACAVSALGRGIDSPAADALRRARTAAAPGAVVLEAAASGHSA